MPDCALSVNFNVADREFLAVGVKVMLTEQLVPAASEPEQPLENGKSVAFAPVTVTPMLVSAVVPVFLSVTVLAAVDVPTF